MAGASSTGQGRWTNISIVLESPIRQHWSGGSSATDTGKAPAAECETQKPSWGLWGVTTGAGQLLLNFASERLKRNSSKWKSEELRWLLVPLKSHFFFFLTVGALWASLCVSPIPLPYSWLPRLPSCCSPNFSLFFEVIFQMTCLKHGACRVTFGSK